MNTYPISSENGHQFAFEIDNAYISPRNIAGLLYDVNGVTDIQLRRGFVGSDEIHIEFLFHGSQFIVWEPYGDSSRYWIGPKDIGAIKLDLSALMSVFQTYKPPTFRKLVGDLITLNWRALLRVDN